MDFRALGFRVDELIGRLHFADRKNASAFALQIRIAGEGRNGSTAESNGLHTIGIKAHFSLCDHV